MKLILIIIFSLVLTSTFVILSVISKKPLCIGIGMVISYIISGVIIYIVRRI